MIRRRIVGVLASLIVVAMILPIASAAPVAAPTAEHSASFSLAQSHQFDEELKSPHDGFEQMMGENRRTANTTMRLQLPGPLTDLVSPSQAEKSVRVEITSGDSVKYTATVKGYFQSVATPAGNGIYGAIGGYTGPADAPIPIGLTLTYDVQSKHLWVVASLGAMDQATTVVLFGSWHRLVRPITEKVFEKQPGAHRPNQLPPGQTDRTDRRPDESFDDVSLMHHTQDVIGRDWWNMWATCGDESYSVGGMMEYGPDYVHAGAAFRYGTRVYSRTAGVFGYLNCLWPNLDWQQIYINGARSQLTLPRDFHGWAEDPESQSIDEYDIVVPVYFGQTFSWQFQSFTLQGRRIIATRSSFNSPNKNRLTHEWTRPWWGDRFDPDRTNMTTASSMYEQQDVGFAGEAVFAYQSPNHWLYGWVSHYGEVRYEAPTWYGAYFLTASRVAGWSVSAAP